MSYIKIINNWYSFELSSQPHFMYNTKRYDTFEQFLIALSKYCQTDKFIFSCCLCGDIKKNLKRAKDHINVLIAFSGKSGIQRRYPKLSLDVQSVIQRDGTFTII